MLTFYQCTYFNMHISFNHILHCVNSKSGLFQDHYCDITTHKIQIWLHRIPRTKYTKTHIQCTN